MAEQAKTSAGLWSSLKDGVNELFLALGTPLNDGIKPLLTDARLCPIIEKTLGAGETIKLRFECLAAHSPTVQIIRGVGNDFELNPRGQLRIFSQKNKFITVQGPGLIFIDMQAGDRFFKEVQMSLFVVMLYCCLYLLMFLIVTFDRFDL